MAKNREVRLRAQKKYDEAHREDYKKYLLKCNKETEADIIDFLEGQTNKGGTIKEALRQYMKSGR